MIKPSVAHIVRNYYALTENWIYTQVKHLHNYRSIVLTLRTENIVPKEVPNCYPLLERSRGEWWYNRIAHRFVGYYPSFLQQIKKNQVRVLHAHFGNRAYGCIPLAQSARLPLITSVYGYDVSQLPKVNPIWRERYQSLFNEGVAFLVEGPFMGQQLAELGCPEEKIIVHHLGVEIDRYAFVERRLQENEPIRMLVAGRFTEKKGIIYAIQVLGKLIAQGAEARLTVIGDANDTNLEKRNKQEILSAIQYYGIAAHVDLQGMQPLSKLHEAYYEHHIFLAPSIQAQDGNNEGGAPVTVIEAAATGMPVIGSRHCDIPSVVEDGITGYLESERDTDSMAARVLEIMNKPEKIREFSRAARHHVKANYDAVAQGRKLANIYDRFTC